MRAGRDLNVLDKMVPGTVTHGVRGERPLVNGEYAAKASSENRSIPFFSVSESVVSFLALE